MHTKTHILIRRLSVVGAGSALALLGASSAIAAPPGDVPLGEFTCTDGSSISPVAKDVPGFMHTEVGFVSGKAIVPLWISGEESGTITITGGPYAGEAPSYSAQFSGPVNGRRVTERDLGALTKCSSAAVNDSFSITIDQEVLDFTGIDAKYLEATADVVAVRQLSVYVPPRQLAHR